MKKWVSFAMSFVLMVSVLTVCPKAESYATHFETSEDALLDDYYGDKLKGIGSYSAILTEKNDHSFEGNVQSALLVNTTKNKVIASQDALKKAYPASTTKVLTALLTLEHCKMDEEVTVKHNIHFKGTSVVAVGLKKGDKIKVEGLLNALLIESANDCAVVLAEHIAGSTKEFAKMMNKRAKELGATHCNFVTSNGLHEANHYVTGYDMYLIFREAIKNDAFLNIVKKASYTLNYQYPSGALMSVPMETTNHYILGDYRLPEGVFMIGGKTGTTDQAGSCLVVLTQDSKGQEYISIVYNAQTKDVLYHTMTDLLEKIHK